MAQIDFVKLAAQGRSFDATRAWSEEELAALLVLETCGVDRKVAADYVRNGIKTVAQYEKAQLVGFVPKSLEDLRTDAIAAHQQLVRDALGEIVDEPEVVIETEEVLETTEVVDEPEVVIEADSTGKSGKKGGKK